MKQISKFKISGKVTLTRINGEDGSRDVFVYKNLVVNYGLQMMARYLAGESPTKMEYLAVGTGTQAPTPGDSSLQTPLGVRKQANATIGSGGDAHKVTFNTFWGPNEAVGAITEAGLFDAVSAGNMFSRSTFTAVNITPVDSLIVDWEFTFAAS